MRTVICYISLTLSAFLVAGCGQSGALHMPNDPNYDQRARYLLYKNTAPQTEVPSPTEDAPVQQKFAAPTP